ncbi:MAG: pyridoxamine 5'-phosphate oxidase [Gammaproteobacteria bacterium]|nr:pyridoxamine 5'-phosphate oxidase [Gammaproteobacteria bacterium]MCY4356088.1 pyridoxamine 5'-phosphate oxidase [Gammaproteobacteria bacterium]
MDLKAFRREYKGGLHREDLADDPFVQFEHWMSEVLKLGIVDPTAMTVATVDANGQPSQRMVLLKQVDSDGLVFYTNYGSRKALELAGNPLISLHFPWHMVDRQVKICGRAGKVSAAESLKYFVSRPRDSQIAAIASQQSSRLSSRSVLMNQFESMKQKFQQGEIPVPDFWGGYRVVPSEFEFWQGSQSRLHDRFRYSINEGIWIIDRLAP